MDLSRKISRSLQRRRVSSVEGGLLREEAPQDELNRLVVADWDSGGKMMVPSTDC